MLQHLRLGSQPEAECHRTLRVGMVLRLVRDVLPLGLRRLAVRRLEIIELLGLQTAQITWFGVPPAI